MRWAIPASIPKISAIAELADSRQLSAISLQIISALQFFTPIS
jgi:hypothetical protein